MKSETSKEIIEDGLKQTSCVYLFNKSSAESVKSADMELNEKLAQDIHQIVEIWDKSDNEFDDIHVCDVRKLQAEINRLRTALSESEKRCEIAEKVIAQKNAEPRGVGDRGMTLNHYQEQAMTTCLPSSANDCYMLFGLVEEVGELCGKVSKGIRKGWVSVDDNSIDRATDDNGTVNEFQEQIKSECGDVLWMLAGLCRQLGWTLEDVAQYNIDKLAKRKDSGTLVTHEDH